MAKYNEKKARHEFAQSQLGRTNTLWDQYQRTLADQGRDYSNIMGRYQNFADTGGYSSQDLSNIRARSVSPIRSAYTGAMRDMDRQRSLQGGYSPNYMAARARMARESSAALADANTNVEASIAQMIQQGRLQGLSGMGNMYSATPGRTSLFGQMYGNQANNYLNTLRLNKGRGIPWGTIGKGALGAFKYIPLGGGGKESQSSSQGFSFRPDELYQDYNYPPRTN